MPCWDEYRPTGPLGAFRGDAGNKPYWHSPHLPSLCMVAWTVKPPIPISQPPSTVPYYFYFTQATDPRGILRSFSFHWSSIEHLHWASQKCPSIQSLSSIASCDIFASVLSGLDYLPSAPTLRWAIVHIIHQLHSWLLKISFQDSLLTSGFLIH